MMCAQTCVQTQFSVECFQPTVAVTPLSVENIKSSLYACVRSLTKRGALVPTSPSPRACVLRSPFGFTYKVWLVRGSSAHREGGRSIGPVKGGGSGKSYLRSGASPGIVKPTGLIPFAAHLSTEIRHRSSPRIAAAAAAAVRSKGVRWSTALAAQRAGMEVAADRTMRAGADSLHQQQQQVREGRKSPDSLDHLRELLASEQREASLEARTEMDG